MQEQLNKRNIEALHQGYKKQQSTINELRESLGVVQKNNLNLSNKIDALEKQVRSLLIEKYTGRATIDGS